MFFVVFVGFSTSDQIIFRSRHTWTSPFDLTISNDWPPRKVFLPKLLGRSMTVNAFQNDNMATEIPGCPSKNTWGCEIKKLGACGWRRLRGTLGQSPFSNKPSKKTDAINKGIPLEFGNLTIKETNCRNPRKWKLYFLMIRYDKYCMRMRPCARLPVTCCTMWPAKVQWTLKPVNFPSTQMCWSCWFG